MDVTKAPPTTDLTSLGVGSSVAADVSTAPNASATVTAAADRVDIQPLDVAAALQILIAEVRAELPLPGAPQAQTLPILPALPAAEFVAAELVASEMPGTQIPTPPEVDDAAIAPAPTPPADLALLESQVTPLNSSTAAELLARLSNPEPGVPLTPPVTVLTAPPEPLPEAPNLAAVLLGSAVPAGVVPPGLGYVPAAGTPDDVAVAPTVPLPPDGFAVLPPVPLAMEPPGADPGPGADSRVGTPSLPPGVLPRSGLPAVPPSLELDPLEPLWMPPGTRLSMPSALTLLSSPAQASPVLMRMFLQAVPDEAGNPAAWSATVTQLEATLQSSLDRAVSAVEQWRNVPEVVVDAARETRSLVMGQLSDEPLGALWMRPEWLWLTPRMERFRRRRRLARRGLTDPDSWALPEDDIRREDPGRRRDEP